MIVALVQQVTQPLEAACMAMSIQEANWGMC
jgi:hypothetical protein